MPTKTWVNGEEVLAPDLNDYLQKQTVQVFPNVSIRNNAIQVPTVGMVTFLADTGRIEVYTNKTTPPSWRPPWNTAWGLVFQRSIVPDVGLSTNAAWIIRGLPCSIPGRNYKIEYDTNILQGPWISTTHLRFQTTTAGLGLIGDWAITNGWTHRAVLIDVFAGDPSNEVGVIGNSDPGTSSTVVWNRIRVFDVGPV